MVVIYVHLYKCEQIWIFQVLCISHAIQIRCWTEYCVCLCSIRTGLLRIMRHWSKWWCSMVEWQYSWASGWSLLDNGDIAVTCTVNPLITCIASISPFWLPTVPLYVGVVDSPVVQVMAESCNHQGQDLHIIQVILSKKEWNYFLRTATATDYVQYRNEWQTSQYQKKYCKLLEEQMLQDSLTLWSEN